jgi:dihydrofolate reductase
VIVSLVAAMSRNRVIGLAGGIPWHLPRDLRHFKELTVDHTVIMGGRPSTRVRRPLANRRNVA